MYIYICIHTYIYICMNIYRSHLFSGAISIYIDMCICIYRYIYVSVYLFSGASVTKYKKKLRGSHLFSCDRIDYTKV